MSESRRPMRKGTLLTTLLVATGVAILAGDAIVAGILGHPVLVLLGFAPAAVAIALGLVMGRRMNRREGGA